MVDNHSSRIKTLKSLHILFIPATMVDNYSSHSICSDTLEVSAYFPLLGSIHIHVNVSCFVSNESLGIYTTVS